MSETNESTIALVASEWLKAQTNNNLIYKWMKDYGIGESEYGKLLDAMAKGKGVFYHRLYGHHPIYDFPWDQPKHMLDFMEHVFVSDAFTKQGLPIIPGEFLKHPGVIDYCNAKTLQWDFINGFDLLQGTISIYAGYHQIKKYSSSVDSIESFGQLAKELSIGALELAIAYSRKNPVLFLGAMLHLAGTLKGCINDSNVIYFTNLNSIHQFSIIPIEVSLLEYNRSLEVKTTDCEQRLSDLNQKIILL